MSSVLSVIRLTGSVGFRADITLPVLHELQSEKYEAELLGALDNGLYNAWGPGLNGLPTALGLVILVIGLPIGDALFGSERILAFEETV
jgi:hypothetical protein